MVKPPTVNLTVYKNSDRTILVDVLGTSGGEPLAGDTLEFYVYEYAGATPVITKTTALTTEIDITGPSDISIFILPADTVNLVSKRYFFELWHTQSGSGVKVPALIGFFDIITFRLIEINVIRERLQEAGEETLQYITDEYIPVEGLDTVSLSRKRIDKVVGAWLSSDTNKSGTNYFTGGNFDAYNGKVNLGTPLSNPYTIVKVDYVWKGGLSDDDILGQLDKNQIFVIGYSGVDFDYGAAETARQQQAEQMAFSRTILTVVLMMNGANAAQLGYNFRLHEFEIQSKLWGEGMIAQSLFALYMEEYKEWIQILGRKITFRLAPKEAPRYNLNQQIYKQLGQRSDSE